MKLKKVSNLISGFTKAKYNMYENDDIDLVNSVNILLDAFAKKYFYIEFLAHDRTVHNIFSDYIAKEKQQIIYGDRLVIKYDNPSFIKALNVDNINTIRFLSIYTLNEDITDHSKRNVSKQLFNASFSIGFDNYLEYCAFRIDTTDYEKEYINNALNKIQM